MPSVVIPTWNSAATLARALASVDEPAAEILVIDDATDDRDAIGLIVAADPRATLIRKPERSGAAHSRALGLARAAGELVLFLDADDRFLPGHIARRRALHAETGAGVAFGRFRLSDGRREWDGPMARFTGKPIEDYVFAGGGDARSSTLSVHKPAWRGTTFDAGLRKHQDWGFALAACRAGERIAFDEAAGAIISVAGAARMSARSDVDASLAFARERIAAQGNRRRFLLARLRTSLRLGDRAAARRFRHALLDQAPSGRERWGSAALLLASELGVARPLHRLLARR